LEVLKTGGFFESWLTHPLRHPPLPFSCRPEFIWTNKTAGRPCVASGTHNHHFACSISRDHDFRFGRQRIPLCLLIYNARHLLLHLLFIKRTFSPLCNTLYCNASVDAHTTYPPESSFI
jgi:hypothetical protein